MNTLLFVVGILLCLGGAIPLAVAHLDPLPTRKRHRLARMFNYRARRMGLRGRYEPVKLGASGGYGVYQPADDEDRALFAAVGSSVESESAFFATETLWNDERLTWAGVLLLVLGVIILVPSALL